MNTKQLLYLIGLAIVFLIIAAIFAKLDGKDVLPNKDAIKGDPLSGTNTYTVDTSLSTMRWTGSKTLLKEYSHTGKLSLTSGTITVRDGVLSAGSLTADMTSLTSTEHGTGAPADGVKLDAHLKSPDFFNVAKYPTTTFTVASVEKDTSEGKGKNDYIIKGNLTIKDISKSVDIPATIVLDEGNIHMIGSVAIDRTLWNIKYGSGKFFKDLGDKIIDDTFIVTFDIVAKPPFNPAGNKGVTATTSTEQQ